MHLVGEGKKAKQLETKALASTMGDAASSSESSEEDDVAVDEMDDLGDLPPMRIRVREPASCTRRRALGERVAEISQRPRRGRRQERLRGVERRARDEPTHFYARDVVERLVLEVERPVCDNGSIPRHRSAT